MRDLLDIEAMLIRRKAAAKLIGEVDGWDLLALIVAPPKAAAEASRKQAEETGPSTLARELAKIAARQPRKERASDIPVDMPEALTIDEALALAQAPGRSRRHKLRA